ALAAVAYADVRTRAAEAAPLSGDAARRLGESRGAAVRVADPARRRLRRLRARDLGPLGLDARRSAPVHGASRADAPEYRRRPRSGAPDRRGAARPPLVAPAARSRTSARADGSPPRRSRLSRGLVG